MQLIEHVFAVCLVESACQYEFIVMILKRISLFASTTIYVVSALYFNRGIGGEGTVVAVPSYGSEELSSNAEGTNFKKEMKK